MKSPDFPQNCKLGHGVYDLKVFNDWMVTHFYAAEKKTSMAEEKLRLIKARADREEMITGELCKKLIPREKVTADLTMVSLGIRMRLLNWSKSIPPKIEGRGLKECSQVIRDETYFILSELSQGMKAIMPKKSKEKRGKRK